MVLVTGKEPGRECFSLYRRAFETSLLPGFLFQEPYNER